ncbi:uncharacterized protein LOC109864460 isoform X1 [Oncorhynchus kisutch]|uniref:uncharacterized protein LOC109864460 isoform X1 n=1 Tax=Oncorhynchus kisutch TaxID=8019 RepID=UPI0012DFD286|nr:uncharacterized protein LOC109864460 isoform X1 [Oncorhynchus kisutch]
MFSSEEQEIKKSERSVLHCKTPSSSVETFLPPPSVFCVSPPIHFPFMLLTSTSVLSSPAISATASFLGERGLGEADVNPNNGCPSEKASAATDSTGTEGPSSSWNEASTADADDSTAPRPHLVRLFSRDAPGREDNTFKDRPSESDELQTIQEHSGAGSECGSEDQDLD